MTKINRNDSSSTRDLAAEEARRQAELQRQEELRRQALQKMMEEARARAQKLLSGFDRNRRRDDPNKNKLLGGSATASKNEVQAKLDAEAAYAKLAQNKAARSALEKLGVHDGETLRGFGQRLAREAAGGEPRQNDVPLQNVAKEAGPKAFATIVKSAASTVDGEARALLEKPSFANAIAAGSSPKEAAEAANGLGGLANDKLAKLGLQTSDLKGLSAEATPILEKAAELATKGDLSGAFGELRKLPATAGAVTEKVARHFAEKLPEGPARNLLSDEKLVHELVSSESSKSALGKLAKGDLVGAARDMIGCEAARDRTIELMAAEPTVAAQLEKLGLTAEDLKKVGKGLPDILAAGEAAARGDNKAAVTSLIDAAKDASVVAEKAIIKTAGKLPEGAAKTVLTDPSVVSDLVNDASVHGSIGKLVQGDVAGSLLGLVSNEKLRDHVAEALANDASIKPKLEKLGLDAEDLKTAGKALPDLYKAADAAANGDTKGAIDALASAAKSSTPIAEKAVTNLASKLPENGAAGIARSVLTDKKVVHDLLADKNLHGSLQKLVAGDLDGALADISKAGNVRNDVIDALAANESVKSGLGKIGLTSTELKQSLDALPEIVGAAQDAAGGEMQLALRHLSAAAEKAPAMVEKAIIAVAKKLPDSGPAGMAKALFSDPEFVSTVVEDHGVHAAFQKMVSGEFTAGLGELLSNESISGKVSKVLAGNATVRKVLEPLGIETAADIAAMGKALPEMMELAQDIHDGKTKEAFGDLGRVFSDLPPELRGRMVGKLCDKLNLPPWAKNVATATAGLLGNKEVAASFGQAVEAFQRGDVSGFVSGLAETARLATAADPAVAKSFLNSLSKLPGSIGKLFASPELNEIVVDSGSVEHVFEAAKRMAAGDISGALEQLGTSLKDLLSAGAPLKAGGKELPIGEDGMKALGLMFERFIDALPPKVKAKITEATAKMAAKVGLSAVPVFGDIVGTGADAWDLVQAIRDDKSGLDIALAASKVALDVAGAFQVVKPFTVPLKMAIGTVQVIKTTGDVIGSVQDFQKEFAGLGQ
jgi:uncharacterized protein YgfB (UPF0149 family)